LLKVRGSAAERALGGEGLANSNESLSAGLLLRSAQCRPSANELLVRRGSPATRRQLLVQPVTAEQYAEKRGGRPIGRGEVRGGLWDVYCGNAVDADFIEPSMHRVALSALWAGL
jgi:hypothetical protein